MDEKEQKPTRLPIQPGDIVYFSEAKPVPNNPITVRVKGFGYGLLLGMVAKGQAQPPLDLIKFQLGSFGFLGLQDIEAIIGKEATIDLHQKWHALYADKLKNLPTPKEALPSPIRRAPGLLGPDGRPIGTA